MRRVPAVWAGLVLLAITGFAGSAAAQGLQLGPFRVLPSLGLSIEYDDNILLTPEDEIDDFIFHIIPGVVLELPSRKYAIRLGYQADVLRYFDNTDLDTVHHAALADARVNFNFGLSLRLTDRFLVTDDFAGFPVPELTERVERLENTLDAGMDYTVRERYTLDVNYRWFMVDYQRTRTSISSTETTTTSRGPCSIGSSRRRRSSGRAGTPWSATTRPASALDRDSDAWRFLVGVKGDITAKTTALIKIGWEWKDYENRAREDWDGIIAEGERRLEVPRAFRGPAVRWPRERRVDGSRA